VELVPAMKKPAGVAAPARPKRKGHGRKPTGGKFGEGGSLLAFPIEVVKQAIFDCKGIVSEVAAQLGMERASVYRTYLQRHEELREAVEQARETNLDRAESKLIAAIDKGEPWAIQFYLNAVGRRRGYGGGLVDFQPNPENGTARPITAVRAGVAIERMSEKQVLLFAATRKYGAERLGLPADAEILPAPEKPAKKRGTTKKGTAGAPRRSRDRKPRVGEEEKPS
jgi:hypothetical protein